MVLVKYVYVHTYMTVCTTAKILNYCLGLFSVAYECILLSWQWLWWVKHVCKVSLSYVLHFYGLDCVLIACSYLTNMQGCHGNCSCGLYVCTEYHG